MRGIPLRERQRAAQERLERLASTTDLLTPNIMRIWETGLNAPLDRAVTWLHGDLHPANVLVNQGTISGVIDWGDITSGDPATDLASIWMLFGEPQSHADALGAYGGVSDATLHRAKAWAVHFGVMFLETGLADTPSSAELGKTILQRLNRAE
jgi:aminoglycoside phosphotransferase (APT) family kinase protein